ncbi:MAG: cupin domain-containing protein [Acidobacteria bacterium]|nr:cupin domain-containing protein [Acidobacteriota bacterium]
MDTHLQLEHRHTGEWLRIRRVRDRDQVVLEIEGGVPPHAQGPPLHIHIGQREEGVVLRGVQSGRVGARTVTIRAGEPACFPANVSHRWWNDGDEPLVFKGRAIPATVRRRLSNPSRTSAMGSLADRAVAPHALEPSIPGLSGCPPKELISLFQQSSIRLPRISTRREQSCAVESLKTMNQHRAVRLIEHVLPHFDNGVGRDSNEVPIEGGMMKLAQREAVGNGRHAERIRIRHDMRGLEQFVAFEPAHRTVMLIGANDALAKLRLIQPLPE